MKGNFLKRPDTSIVLATHRQCLPTRLRHMIRPAPVPEGEAPEEAEAVEEAAGVAVATASKAVDRI